MASRRPKARRCADSVTVPLAFAFAGDRGEGVLFRTVAVTAEADRCGTFLCFTMEFDFDTHIHTPLCGHALGEPEGIIEAADERGLRMITFTCHIPMPDDSFGGRGIRMRREELPVYRRFVGEAKRLGEARGIEVRYGIEAEIFPDEGVMAQMDEILKAEPFDFVLGSLHHQLPAYHTWLRERGLVTDAEVIRHYFRHLEAGMHSGRYDSVAHPDLIRLYGTLAGPFDPADYEEVIRGALRAAAESGSCWEINTSGKFKGQGPHIHPLPEIFAWAVEEGVAFTLGSDTHAPEMLAQGFDDARRLLDNHGVASLRTFLKREPEERPVTARAAS